MYDKNGETYKYFDFKLGVLSITIYNKSIINFKSRWIKMSEIVGIILINSLSYI